MTVNEIPELARRLSARLISLEIVFPYDRGERSFVVAATNHSEVETEYYNAEHYSLDEIEVLLFEAVAFHVP